MGLVGFPAAGMIAVIISPYYDLPFKKTSYTIETMNSKTFTYVLVGAWALLMGLLPFIVSSGLFFPYITGKNLFFRIIVEIVLVLWIVSCIRDRELRPRWSWLMGIFTGFIVWIGIANIFGIDPLKSFWSNYERMEGYITFLHLFALFLVSAQTLTKDLWYKLMAWSVGISGITWIQGMVEHVKNSNMRIDGNFGNPTYFAAYALMHIFFAMILALRYAHYRYFWGIFALANFITIFYTGTRGALLGVIGGAVVAAIIYAVKEWDNKKVRNVSLAVIGFVVLCTVGLGLAKDVDFIAKSPVLSRFGQLAHYAITLDAKGLFEDVGRSRTAIWGIAWEGVKERPIMGWGQDNFIPVFSKYYDPTIFDQEQWFDRTHNVFFDWLIAAGFVGLLGYLGIFAAMLWYLWRKDAFELHEKILLTALCTAYFIHTFFVFDNITTYIFLIFILAMVQHVAYKHVTDRKKGEYVQSSGALVLGGTIAAIALAISVNAPVYATGSDLIKGLLYTHNNGTQPPTDMMVKEAKKYFLEALDGAEFAKVEIREQLVDTSYRVRMSAASSTTKGEFLEMVTEQIHQSVADRPFDARTNYFAGMYYGSIGDYERAVAAMERALEASPRKQTIMFTLAETYKRTGSIDKAIELYKQAHEADTRFIEPRLRYADILLSSGKKAEAQHLISSIPDDSLEDPRYVNFLIQIDRYDIIVRIFERELRNNPNNIQARVSLAAAYVEVGRKDDAIAVLETISRDVPDAKSQVDYFISEIKAGRNPVQR